MVCVQPQIAEQEGRRERERGGERRREREGEVWCGFGSSPVTVGLCLKARGLDHGSLAHWLFRLMRVCFPSNYLGLGERRRDTACWRASALVCVYVSVCAGTCMCSKDCSSEKPC